MNNVEKISEQLDFIKEFFQVNNPAVLATEGAGQPHASLVAITPTDEFRQLIFATYRATRKYENLMTNEKVAVLVENRSLNNLNQLDSAVVTAFGAAVEVGKDDYERVLQIHAAKHPELRLFLMSTDCAIFRVAVNSYQIVRGIDDVSWCNIKSGK
ncbi:MAG: pyridoxamine 5'-phosphate oxidase family protein [Spirochaetales bacterium]|nr:pyridoxamine 5'-phosphate oxidase family protein [Spirochaetales bacterium]